MKRQNESNIFVVERDKIAVVQLIRATTDSSFTLLRGVPSNEDARIDEYLWSEVISGGQEVTLSLKGDNPMQIAIPGTYKFRNNGTDDESALIDITVYK